MSDTTDSTVDPDEVTPDKLKALRDAASGGNAAKRELAMVKAGIDTDTPLGKMFLRSYEGELTQELIVAAATEVGAIKPPPAADAKTPEQLEADRIAALSDAEQQEMRDKLRAGGGNPAGNEPPETEHPVDTALGRFHDSVKKGMTSEKAGLGAIDEILMAAGKGDKRVLL